MVNINISHSVTTIGAGAFSDCVSLTQIKIPNSVTSIGGLAFSGCRSLTDIELPNLMTYIDDRAFHNCISLTNVELPPSLIRIGRGAFEGCTNLKAVNVFWPEPVSTYYVDDEHGDHDEDDSDWEVEGYIWGEKEVSSATPYVPKGTKELYDQNMEWSRFASIVERD